MQFDRDVDVVTLRIDVAVEKGQGGIAAIDLHRALLDTLDAAVILNLNHWLHRLDAGAIWPEDLAWQGN